MPIDPKTLHPTVWQEVDRLVTEGYWGQGLQGNAKAAITQHYDVWMKEYGSGCAVKSLAIIGAIVAAIAAVPEGAKAVVAITGLVLGICAFAYLYKQNARQITPNELQALAPALNLTPIQRHYVEAVIILNGISLAEESKHEIVQQMNRLMDEEVHLREMGEKGRLSTPSQDLETERTHIFTKLGATTDPVSREALTRSLEICESRIAASTEKVVIAQRIDSQLAMISQSMGNMRDMLSRLKAAPMNSTLDVDLSPIRQAIESAQSHASALESAVNEIQSVGQ